MCLHSRSGILQFAIATPNKKSKSRLQAPLIGHYPSRPIVYTVKRCHCTFFRQGESQTSNNQTTTQTDAPSNHQGPISGDIWWRNRGYYMAAQKYKIFLQVLKNLSRVSRANEWNIFQHEKRNFVSPSDHVMLCLLYKHQWNTKPFYLNSFLLRKVWFIFM